ncbi:FG-GAP and VCBS repeat-containing protein [Streptomyces sp. AP-93]|uniref:FG-GAP and VCBS repeat-containing protein n=1 Tax=Streptomyces sp. AP-93 TaxID=2929048 RepID=UPI001FAF2944|nr:FG-GAP and VCBS repeat-containing protein [Streptomyces sp. AP-93]MCJ0873668.1 VCBS repeat-containing protein [Streptomyces sp. AP-93]
MRRHIRHSVAIVAALTTLTGGLLAATGTQAAEAATTGPAATRYADDFNGDGHHDLAIGAPDAAVNVTGTDGATTPVHAAGYVTVSYGSKYGAQKTGLKVITQNSPGIPGDPTQSRQFGAVLTNGDFNGDGYADLAVGTRDDQVTLIWGSATGLQSATSMADPRKAPGFGVVLKAGDFTGDGRTDLVVGYSTSLRLFRGPFKADGSPLSTQAVDLGREYPVFGAEDAQNRIAVGRINKGAIDDLVVLGERRNYDEAMRGRVLLGGTSGLRFTPVTIRGGGSVAIADFDKDGYGDIAVGDSAVQIDTDYGAGVVRVNYGSANGVDDTRGVRTFTEDSDGLPGTVEKYDRFGNSVAAADLNLDGYPELIIGALGERKATCEHCYITGGGFYVLKGTSKGVTGIGAAWYAHNAPGLPTPAGTYRIPTQLKITDLNNDKQPELTFAVGALVPQLWSVGTKDGKVAGTSPTRVVNPPTDPQVKTGLQFGVLAR